MARQYLRSYELIITSAEGERRTIRELRVIFEITKSVLSFPNLAKVVIYNPNPDTIASLQTKYTKVVLNAGYGDNLKLLFKGEVRNVLQTKIGVNRLITFYAGDGERDWQNSFINKTYSETVSITAIVNDIISTFKETTKGVIEGVPDIADSLMGETVSGSSKDILDRLAKQYGFEWNIQNGEITIVEEAKPLSTLEAVVINAGSGMVGSPTVTEIGADVTTLMNPDLIPNSAFKIESVNADIQLGNLFFRTIKRTSAEGLYKVQEVFFKGDSREGDWLSTVKGRTLHGFG